VTCKLCASDPQPEGFLDPRKCAFKTDEFDPDNWACATMSMLRFATEVHTRNDESIAVLPISDCVESATGFLVMTFYKQRGRTGQAYIMCDAEEPAHLTLQQAEEILASIAPKIELISRRRARLFEEYVGSEPLPRGIVRGKL
jgi:hypothetical protein